MSVSPVSRSVPPEIVTRHFDPVLKPDLAPLYAAREARLNALAADHPAGDYLRFVADVTHAQAGLLDQVSAGSTDPATAASEPGWLDLLDRLMTALKDNAPAAVAPHFDAIAAMDRAARQAAGVALATGRFSQVDAAIAPILWAALSEQVAVSVRAEDAAPVHAGPHDGGFCPVCGTAPVASMVYGGMEMRGLRYLHCALCESEWHVVRAVCSNCGDGKDVEYLSFDTAEAVVRAECCDHCHGYLKIVSAERERTAEAVADDLATLDLDDAVANEEYRRTGFNPWALPREDSAGPERVN
ncbi:formate dehydrogenase accessory protein FdhE [Paenirhodobacter enshiensis]|uniref:formate dehydrogenase accessory protein FdhE n=1 Tax=Paenirhodobacter enshiensis TaxID=1105367 RepID=UPI00068DA482|nr:formate dehydrogenase accessory protein FdhE [Paenirhodobacter enshiensis]